MDFLGNSISADWPMGMNGLGATSTIEDIGGLWKRVDDLNSFGKLTVVDNKILNSLLMDATPKSVADAKDIIEDKEHQALTKKAKLTTIQKLGKEIGAKAKLPSGWGFAEQKVDGVPNWVLYGVAGAFLLMTLRSLRKKK